jgi:hypothetical protein
MMKLIIEICTFDLSEMIKSYKKRLMPSKEVVKMGRGDLYRGIFFGYLHVQIGNDNFFHTMIIFFQRKKNTDMRYFTLPIILFLVPYFIYAQHMVQVERCQALPEGIAIHDVYTDNGGYVWVASEEGLFNYSPQDGAKKIIPDVPATAFARDDAGRLWVGFGNGEVSTKDKKSKFNISNKGEAYITHMMVKENELWIGTESKGIYVWDIMSMSFIANHRKGNSRLPSDHINFVHRDDAGVLWVGTDRGVCRIDGGSWKTFEKADDITAVTSYNNDVWFLGNRKLWKVTYDNRWAQIRLDRRLTNGAVQDMAFDQEGRLYLASNIFSRYDIIEDTLAVYSREIGFVSDQSLAVTCDSQGNMWVGTKLNGLFRFRLYFKEAEVASAKFSAICFSDKILNCHGDNNGSLRVKASGGTPPYSYQWNCDGCYGEHAKGLSAGDYSVTVTDQSGAKNRH